LSKIFQTAHILPQTVLPQLTRTYGNPLAEQKTTISVYSVTI